MKRTYKTANPFGKLDLKDLETFEKIINYRLPNDYRSYLLEFNGAEPINPYCTISNEEGEAKIHGMLGIHNGPEYVKLEPSFGDNNNTKNTGMLGFAYDEGGNYFCLCLKPDNYGEVYFYDHESSEANKIDTLVKVTDSFDKFIASLFSEEEFMRRLAENYPEIYERLMRISNDPSI